MQIIPVIDLKDGLVVHAIRGDRANYRAIHHHSILTDSSDIDAVLAGFLKLYPFRAFYIADLNAITASGNNNAMIRAFARAHPDLEFWLDNGAQLSEIENDTPNLTWVIGTESQQSEPQLTNQDFILSLDFKNQQQVGLPAWFNQSQFWPNRLIAMSLSRVGSNNGPDFQKLMELRQRHLDKQVVAAGGIRNSSDLRKLRNIGIHAALLATSLHSGSISGADIQNL